VTRDLQREPHPLIATVREFVEKEVTPVASALEHADTYPHELVARMKDLGLFGSLVPREYGGLGLEVTTYARVIEEICRGWMSLAGVINSHTMAALIVLHHGTDEQRQRFLPRFARGEARGGLCLTEPHAGSDVQAIRTVARRDGDRYLISGSKMFVTNGREGNTFALLALTDPAATPRHRGMSCFIVEKGHQGLQVVKSISKLGYKGVDTAELLFEGFPVPATSLVGGIEGRGFRHVMSGLETGRINIAARAVGVAQAALDGARLHLAAAAPGDGVLARSRIADMATRLAGARLLTYWAAGMKDAGTRCDLEAGMAKLFASETAQALAAGALAIMGEEGYATRHAVERHYRDAPLMIIGEGTNEIQRLIICRNLLDRYGERPGALKPLDDQPEERRQMVLAVRQLVEREIVPAAGELDHGGDATPLLEKLAAMGLLGAAVPQEHGGLGLDDAGCALIAEELGRGSMALAVILESHLAVARLVHRAGTEAQRRRWLPELAMGRRRGGLVSPGRSAATVSARGDGEHVILSGSGLTVPAGRHVERFAIVVPDPPGPRCFIVEAGTPGLMLTGAVDTAGLRGAGGMGVTLRDCRVPAASLLGDGVASDPALVAGALAASRIQTAAAAVGLAQAALEAAIRYSQQRSAFGVPICQHQAIQLKLADMATRVTVARLLALHAAGLAGAGGQARAAMAWRESSRAAYEVALESMRIHGGYGYTTEFPVERYYRDAGALLARAGADEPSLMAIARHVLDGSPA
jgi:alkylation response protein AidB-like acyl-CoA dehydrogenase